MGVVVYNKMSFLGAPKENAGFSENPVLITLLEHLFFFFQENRELFRLANTLLANMRKNAKHCSHFPSFRCSTNLAAVTLRNFLHGCRLGDFRSLPIV